FTTFDPTPGQQSKGGQGGTQAAAGGDATGGTAGTTATTGGTAGPGGGTSTTSTTAGGTAPGRAAVEVALLPDARCDPVTGRLAVPTRYAPPCVPSVAGNGGATYQGVTGETITVAVYVNRLDPAAQALLTAAGFNDSEEDIKATYRSYVEYFEHHYQTWGRKVKLVFVDPSGADDDDTAARADAIRVATEIKAFASWGGPIATTAYADELAARKVLCICTVSQPIEYYTARAPYVISTLMGSTQGYLHRAEYVGKRLAGRPARYAGDVFLAQQPRKFGLLYYETAEQSYGTGVEFFERELSRYGVQLAEKLAFTGANIDPTATQEQARTMIARLKEAGVTSVLFAGDPLSPVFFTQEATRQRYTPEWVLTGSAFTDTSFFARTYDQTQWAHAFGLSFLPARLPVEQGDAYRVHLWHHGSPPPAEAAHGLIYTVPWIFYTGMHLGGPALTPETIRDGLFRFPPTGRGSLTNVHVSFGRHGVWPFDDYLANDDATEVWWDGTATGEDEVGNSGLGMYRYVAGGRRYLPGQHPTTDPFVFARDRTVTIYSEPPPSDRPPSYDHKA
ncbi:MAG: hypothetical protein M3357_07550, partial [Actinomycetota bacterium]|nr:hypothetical protein [Actinomycetota bacterium]